MGKSTRRMFVGIISDTHGVFSPAFKKFLEPVDCIWHAGDFGGGIEFIEEIAAFKPLIGVRGNCDGLDIRDKYPEVKLIEEQGLRILLKHIGGSPGRYDKEAKVLIDSYKPDIFVCGHSHILKVMHDKGRNMLYINPGAAGLQGWHIERTALRLKIDSNGPRDMELFRLPRSQKD